MNPTTMTLRSVSLMAATMLAVLAGSPVAATAQVMKTPSLSTQALFLEQKLEPVVFKMGKWAASGPIVTFVQTNAEGESAIVSVNLEDSTETVILDGSDLMVPDTGKRLVLESYEMSPDGSKILLYADAEKVWRKKTKGYYYIYDVESNDLIPLSDREYGFQMFAKFDPTGGRIGFVRNRNLFVFDIDSASETQLTRDGGPGAIINGTSDWVYEEELGVRDAWRWSPDGSKMAFLQFDETRTRDYWLADNRGLYPEFTRYRYPKAGERNSEIRVGVVDVDSLSTVFFDTGTWFSSGGEHEYLNALGWTPSGDAPSLGWVLRLNRDQNKLDLMYLDPTSKEAWSVLRESEPTYINSEIGLNDLDIANLTYLKDGRHFVWISEADGFRHLYLHRVDGERLGRLTSGDWDVTEFHGVDEQNGVMYFTATIAGPTERHLYSMPFSVDTPSSTETPQQITTEEGWHDVDLSEDRQFFIDRYTTSEMPETVTLRAISGEIITTLENNDDLKERLADYSINPLSFIQIPGETGESLNAYMVKPRSFKASKKYPLLMFAYGGPGSQRVRNDWLGPRRLWFQMLADTYNMIIVCVDSRGTGGRGKVFESSVYKQLGVLEARDQIAAAKWLKNQAYIDASRVGIWGWSYGGFVTLMSMFTEDGPETFDFGIAVSPVTTWRQYDSIYTERYMSTPQKNPDGYSVSSPISHVDRMSESQRLLVVHGDKDDNVHFQNSIQLVEALQLAGKQFQFMVYPGKDHSISGKKTQFHLYNMLTDFIVDNINAVPVTE